MDFMANSSVNQGTSGSIYGGYDGSAFGSTGVCTVTTTAGGVAAATVMVRSDSPTKQASHSPRRVIQSLPSRYDNQKRRDWNTFSQYLRNHRTPLPLSLCCGAHVLEFLRYLDQFGKTKVHNHACPYFGIPNPPAPCPCPLRQAWGSLDALVGRLRAAYEEHGGRSETNPFGARAVRLYLREVRDYQAKARGVSYEKNRKRQPPKQKPMGITFPTAAN